MPVHCTTIERVKTRIGTMLDDAEHAALLAQWIGSVTASIEAYLGRWIEQKERTETMSPRAGARIVRLRGSPVVSVSLVQDDQLGVFNGSAIVVPATHYGINAAAGRLNFLAWPLSGGPDSLRVTYVGGMAPTTDQFVQLWPAIAGAADSQIAHQYRRRLSDGYANVGGTQTGGASVQGEVLELTQGVRAVLDPFCPLVLGP